MTKPTIVTRASKGSALSWTEGDSNLTNLQNATITLKAGTGGTDVVSDLNGSVTLVAGTNVSLTGDNTAKTVTIDATAPSLALNDLSDVVSTMPSGGQVLTWNGPSNQWQPETPSGGSMALDDLTDVNTTMVTDGQVLTYNSSLVRWEGTTISAGGISDVVSDTTPQLGGNLDVNGNSIVSASNGNIAVTPNGTGKINLDGLYWPTADGSNGQFIKTDGAGNLSFATATVSLALDGLTDVNASAPNSGDTLVWNNASSEWQAQAPSAGSMNLDDLTDVSTMTATNGQVLTYNSSLMRWEATTPASGGVTSVSGTGTVNGLTLTGTVTSTGDLTLGGTLDLTSPPAIGSTSPSTGKFTTLTINAQNELRLADSDSSNYVGFKAPATVSANKVWTLPATDGTSGQFLSTDGSATLSWTTPTSGGNNIILLGSSNSNAFNFPATADAVSTSYFTLISSGGISGVSINSTNKTFTLPAGTYTFELPGMFTSNANWQDFYLRNTTDAIQYLYTYYYNISVQNVNRAWYSGCKSFTIASSKTFRFNNATAGGSSSWALTNPAQSEILFKIYKTA